MKIVQIVTQMEAAGAQRVAYLLHDALHNRGHDTELWFLYLKRPAYIGKPGVRVLAGRRPSLPGRLLLAMKLFAWIRSCKPDVVITHTHYANILGQLAAAFAGVRRRVAVHHSILTEYPAFARYVDWLMGTLGVYTTQIAVSNSVVDSMLNYPRRYRSNVHTIYNGIALGRNSCLPSQRRASVQANSPKILHVGRLSPEKNHELLLKSLEQLPGVSLVLVGDGELRDTLERQAEAMGLAGRVCFMGEVAAENVRALMAACDLFMFPSAYEAMPMALLEAMAAGMPIVASDIPANRELLQDTGVLVPPDPKELSCAAQQLLADACSAKELGRRAAGRARKFSVETMLNGYESLLVPARPT
jgi:glycosyltransferase involved in cell wall biosynthesis